MLSLRWRVLILGVLALAVLLAACGGGSSPAIVTSTQAPDVTSTPMPVGFLPAPTGVPVPGVAADADSVRCPPLPIQTCSEAGNRVNVHEGLRMERAVAIRVTEVAGERWVLEPATIEHVLRVLDETAVLEPISRTVTEGQFQMTVFWPPGEGRPWHSLPDDTIEFIVHPSLGTMAGPAISAQWEMPEGFADRLFESFSSAQPTPASKTPAPPSRPADGIYFEQTEDRLVWEGPDDHVSSLREGHCGPSYDLRYVFGIPALITREQVEEEEGLSVWFSRVVLREDGWRWTGYQHGDWRIW